MTTYKDFTDDVNGNIVGGNFGMCWVSYHGRKQGQIMYPSSKEVAESMCQGVVNRIKEECGDVFNVIYEDNGAWKFHFDGV